MSTNLSVKAFNLYSKFYQRFEIITFMWNSETNQLEFVSDKSKLRKWAFNIFLAPIFSNGCCIYLLVRELFAPVKKLGIDFIVFQTFLVIFALFWLVTSISSLTYGRSSVFSWNKICKMGFM